MPVLADTSVLLRLRDANDPNHSSCRAALDPVQVNRHGILLCAQVLIEYWVVATRPPANNGFGLSPIDAEADVVALRALLACLPAPPDVANRWEALPTRTPLVMSPRIGNSAISSIQTNSEAKPRSVQSRRHNTHDFSTANRCGRGACTGSPGQ